MAGTLDQPSPEPPTQLSFEEYTQLFYLAPRFLPEANFIALDGDEYVGLSALEKNLARPDYLDTGFTCVSRSHRRRNIATALKLKAIAFARNYGAKTIETGKRGEQPYFQIKHPTPGFSASSSLGGLSQSD